MIHLFLLYAPTALITERVGVINARTTTDEPHTLEQRQQDLLHSQLLRQGLDDPLGVDSASRLGGFNGRPVSSPPQWEAEATGTEGATAELSAGPVIAQEAPRTSQDGGSLAALHHQPWPPARTAAPAAAPPQWDANEDEAQGGGHDDDDGGGGGEDDGEDEDEPPAPRTFPGHVMLTRAVDAAAADLEGQRQRYGSPRSPAAAASPPPKGRPSPSPSPSRDGGSAAVSNHGGSPHSHRSSPPLHQGRGVIGDSRDHAFHQAAYFGVEIQQEYQEEVSQSEARGSPLAQRSEEAQEQQTHDGGAQIGDAVEVEGDRASYGGEDSEGEDEICPEPSSWAAVLAAATAETNGEGEGPPVASGHQGEISWLRSSRPSTASQGRQEEEYEAADFVSQVCSDCACSA